MNEDRLLIEKLFTDARMHREALVKQMTPYYQRVWNKHYHDMTFDDRERLKIRAFLDGCDIDTSEPEKPMEFDNPARFIKWYGDRMGVIDDSK